MNQTCGKWRVDGGWMRGRKNWRNRAEAGAGRCGWLGVARFGGSSTVNAILLSVHHEGRSGWPSNLYATCHVPAAAWLPVACPLLPPTATAIAATAIPAPVSLLGPVSPRASGEKGLQAAGRFDQTRSGALVRPSPRLTLPSAVFSAKSPLERWCTL